MNDRLFEFMNRCNLFTGKAQYKNFYSMIQHWKKCFPSLSQYRSFEDFSESVDEWSKRRNKAVHQIVKPNGGNTSGSIDEFLELAKDCAHKGSLLAKAISNWAKSELNKYRNSHPITEAKE